jgi:carbamate kinase
VRLVIALGGNALMRRGERFDAELQARRLEDMAGVVAPLAREHELVITHGNGPHVGWLAQEAGAASGERARPLDVLDAETEGMIGYWIELALASRLPERPVTTLLTRVEVDPADPAFSKPSKPIGPVLPEETIRDLARQRGWCLTSVDGGLRRVVASPDPLALYVRQPVELLLAGGAVVVCAGGGGIPVVTAADGTQRGVEAVVDKDLASSRLAVEIGADALLLLTDVACVWADWPEPRREPLTRVVPEALRSQRFEAGSMAPKVEAACRFVEATRGWAAIGALEQVEAVLAGRSGTRVARTPRVRGEG